MDKYILLKSLDQVLGVKEPYSIVFKSDDISKVEDEIKKRVKDGCAVSKFRIVQDIPFEFKCAIALKKTRSSKPNGHTGLAGLVIMIGVLMMPLAPSADISILLYAALMLLNSSQTIVLNAEGR